MSFMGREGRSATDIEAYCNGMVRRMVNLPRSIVGEVSRVMTDGMNIITMGTSGRYHGQNSGTGFQGQHFFPNTPNTIPEEWVFLTTFEQQYGQSHPFFYACKLMEALKIAEEEHKLLFMYFHSPEHPFTPSFCKDTLCSELAVQFLDANFVSWGALASRGEGLPMAREMRIESFPFCAVVAPSFDSSIAVIQQVEGPVSPTELLEILERTLEEHGLAVGTNKKREEETKRAENRRIREEQEAAYLACLQIDSAKDKSNEVHIEKVVHQKPGQEQNKAKNKDKHKQVPAKVNQGSSTLKETKAGRESANREKDREITQILIRFPNGERREQRFLSSDTIRSIYKYIDSLNLPGPVGYKLVSGFPRKTFGIEQMEMTLKDAGLSPRSSLFVEFL